MKKPRRLATVHVGQGRPRRGHRRVPVRLHTAFPAPAGLMALTACAEDVGPSRWRVSRCRWPRQACRAGASHSPGYAARSVMSAFVFGADTLPAWWLPGSWMVLRPWAQTEPAAAEHLCFPPGRWGQGSEGDGDRVSSATQASLRVHGPSAGCSAALKWCGAANCFLILFSWSVWVWVLKPYPCSHGDALPRARGLHAHRTFPEGGTCSKNLNYQ